MPSLEDLKKAQEQLNESRDLSKKDPPFTISRAISEKQKGYNPPSPAPSFAKQNLGGQATSEGPKRKFARQESATAPGPESRSSLRSERAPLQKPREQALGIEDWFSHQDWLKEIADEKQRLEKTSKEMENWQRKVQERLALVKALEDQSQKINKELKDLQQKIILVKKENNTIFYQIKNEYGNNDIKSDSEK